MFLHSRILRALIILLLLFLLKPKNFNLLYFLIILFSIPNVWFYKQQYTLINYEGNSDIFLLRFP